MAITVIFMVFELVGGYLANSLALISDAAHMLTDVGAMALSLGALWMSRRPVTPTMSYGYFRAEILGALFSTLLIWAISAALIYEAIVRMQSPPEVNGKLVLIVAVVGLAANGVGMWILHSSKNQNMNVKAAYLHLVSDSLGSVGAILSGVLIWLTGWRPIDPLMTIVFALLMVISSWGLVRDTLSILMESTPKGIDPDGIHRALAQLPGVIEVHDLHVWTVASGRYALSAHLVCQGSACILAQARQLLTQDFGITHTTIQVEIPGRSGTFAQPCDQSPCGLEHAPRPST